MTTPEARTFIQIRDDAEQANSVTQWRAAQAVRARVTDVDARAELLGALGLLDVARPQGL